MRIDTPPPVHLVDYQPFPFRIHSIDLVFDLNPDGSGATVVESTLQVERADDGNAPLVLDGEALELVEIELDGAALSDSDYSRTDMSLTLLSVPRQLTLKITTRIEPAKNTSLSGLYISGGRYCTQCEAEGFRRITYWPDRPDVLSRFKTKIIAPAEGDFPILLSNGNPLDSGTEANGRHYAVWDDPHLKPSYLFALCAGDYDAVNDQFTTRSGRAIELNIFVDKGDAPRAHYAMDCLKRSMAWDEQVFGREYDLDVFNIVAVRDFNFGAMENKGLNIFNSAYILADAETATDADFEAIESVVAHEYFHNWTGNRITCRDWFQLCLKEGLTVFRDQEFSADMRSRAVQRIKDVLRLRARQFQEDAGPLAHPVRPDTYARVDNLYTATVYEKGAELIRALKTLIGDKHFATGMALYFERFDGTAATIEDFYSCFEDASGQDLEPFRVWYAQAGTPKVTLETSYNAEQQVLMLNARQTTEPTPGQTIKKPVPIPFRIAAFSPSGSPVPIDDNDEKTLVLDKNDQPFELKVQAGNTEPLLSVNRSFSAPITVNREIDRNSLATLAAVDTDPFAQWDALQSLATQTLLEVASNGNETGVAGLTRAIQQSVKTAASADPAFAALLLRLPDVSDLFALSRPAVPQALYDARLVVKRALAPDLNDVIDDALNRRSEEPFSPDARSAGQRALRAALIDLIASEGIEAEPRLVELYHNATNMTDTMAALRALSSTYGDGFDDALEHFKGRWSAVPLVMDKWYAVQAAAPHVEALDRARKLLDDPEFEWTNPNRVRSVAAAFAMSNLVAFHAPDGSGHAFLADVVIKVDPMNSALSARLLTGFEPWKRLDQKGQNSAQRQLERLKDHGLSENAMDIVQRALGS